MENMNKQTVWDIFVEISVQFELLLWMWIGIIEYTNIQHIVIYPQCSMCFYFYFSAWKKREFRSTHVSRYKQPNMKRRYYVQFYTSVYCGIFVAIVVAISIAARKEHHKRAKGRRKMRWDIKTQHCLVWQSM